MTERPIFGIFEGGGARGVAHIGALSACEDNDFFFVGVAGASAGAIVATLIAAGFDANDILDPDDLPSNLLYRYHKSPVKLLGVDDWERFRSRRDASRPLLKPKGTPGRRRALLCLPWTLQVVVEAWRAKGHFSTIAIRDFVNTVLRDQLIAVRKANGEDEPVPERIAFKDLDWTRYPEFLPLKIMAANVSSQEGVIFDLDRTPDVEIASAVAASVAIPIAFQPVHFEGEGMPTHRYIDGGTISNLPVWVFNDEKLAYERGNPGTPVPIVGFTLKSKTEGVPPKPEQDGLIRHLSKVIATMLSGSQRVVQDFVEDLRVVALQTDLETLQFDASEADILQAHRDGYDCADRALRHHFIDQPALIRAELQRVYDRVREELVKLLPPERRRESWVLRANIVQRFGRDGLRVTYGVNMEQDSDDRLPLDRRGRGAPRAFRTGAPVFTLVNEEHPAATTDVMTKYERALARRDIKAIISVPIYANLAAWELPVRERSDPSGVLSFDSDRADLLRAAFDDLTFKALFTSQSTLLYPALTKEMPLGENPGPA